MLITFQLPSALASWAVATDADNGVAFWAYEQAVKDKDNANRGTVKYLSIFDIIK